MLERTVKCGKLLLDIFLVIEYLYDLLSLYGLFDISVCGSEILLLLLEVQRALAAYNLNYNQHNYKHQNYKKSELPAEIQHHGKGCDNADNRGNHLHKAVAQEISDGIDVVCIAAHKVAVSMRVKIAYRQILHLVKEVAPYRIYRSLRHLYHNSCIRIGRYCTEYEKHSHFGKR